jgi:hypothetical protein
VHLSRSSERLVLLIGLVWLASPGTAFAQIPDLGTGRLPTLAPLVREVTPAVARALGLEFPATLLADLVVE